MTNETVLIIDGDLIAYRNAAAFEKRKVKVTHVPSGRTKEFGTRTEFKESLTKKNFTFVPEDYSYEDIQIPLPFENVKKVIDKTLARMRTDTWADRTEMYLGADNSTFRMYLPLPSPYKDNRSNQNKPLMLREAQQYLIKEHNAKVVKDSLETDDVVTIRAYEELAKGNTPIIATIDKDAYQSQGVCIYNWSEEEPKVITIDELGSLRQHKPAYKGDGIKFLAYQVLAGDPTDTYKPYELSTIPYGPAKAFKALNDCKTEKEVLLAVIKEYKRMYPKPFRYTSHHGAEVIADWGLMLSIYWQCAYMMRSYDDLSDFGNMPANMVL